MYRVSTLDFGVLITVEPPYCYQSAETECMLQIGWGCSLLQSPTVGLLQKLTGTAAEGPVPICIQQYLVGLFYSQSPPLSNYNLTGTAAQGAGSLFIQRAAQAWVKVSY